MTVTNEQIISLREKIREILSPFRFEHTLGVESMAARLAGLYCPEKENLLRAAALLHDVTKEKKLDGQLEIFERYGVRPTEEQISVAPTFHALTAALIIPDEYPEFADRELIEVIRYHSTGRENMTLSDKIIYLSDYIEETRKYDDCITLRKAFFDAEPEKMSYDERLLHLDRIMLKAFDLTMEDLKAKGKIIGENTLRAREFLLRELE